MTSEANIIKKKDKLLGRFIPYFTCKIWNKTTQLFVFFFIILASDVLNFHLNQKRQQYLVSK